LNLTVRKVLEKQDFEPPRPFRAGSAWARASMAEATELIMKIVAFDGLVSQISA
jgi:hypothetical protein